ncbi:MAG: hypothetical protein FWD58_08475 [Firmicutes bacterium]|nr:hypothetical protein [Bacillota bacterium]
MKKVIRSVSVALALVLALALCACIPAKNPLGDVHGKDCECEGCKPPAVHDADCDCEECKPEYVPKGAFYTLQEAFDNGWLTQNEIRSIAYYHNSRYLDDDGIELVYVESAERSDLFWIDCHNLDGSWSGWAMCATNYAPIPKKPEVLSEETEKAIKKDRLDFYLSRPDLYGPDSYGYEITLECFDIVGYYGVYNHCYAISIYLFYFFQLFNGWPTVVADVVFISEHFHPIFIWKEN